MKKGTVSTIAIVLATSAAAREVSWDVRDLEPDPGRRVANLTVQDGELDLKLICSGGQWALYIDQTPMNDDVLHPFSDFSLPYSINGLERSIDGNGQRKFYFHSLRANEFVSDLLREDPVELAFSIPGSKKHTVLTFRGTKKAVSPFLERCPLD